MKTSRILILQLLAALPLLAHAGPKIVGVNYPDPAGEDHQLHLAYEGQTTGQFLCQYVRSAEAVVSPSNTRVAVNEHTASSGGDEIRLFRQVAGLQFEEIQGDPPISTWLLDLVKEKLGIDEYPDDFGCNCVGWTEGESPACIIEVYASSGGSDHVWKTSFSPDTGEMAPLTAK